MVARPSFLAAGTVLAVCLPSQRTNVDTTVHITTGDVVSALLIAVTSLLVIAGSAMVPRGAAVTFGGMLVVFGITTVLSQDTQTSVSGYVRSLQLWVLIPSAVAASIRDRTDTAVICGSVIAASVIEAAIGIWQFVTGAGASIGGATIRAVGTFGATDVMAMATVVSYGFIVTLALFIVTGGYRRAAFVSVLAVQGLAVALSLSRGTWIALGAAGLTMLFLIGYRVALRTVMFGAALAVVVGLGFGAGSSIVDSRLSSITEAANRPDRSVSDRFSLWKTAMAIAGDYPITGVGIKNFPVFRDSYAPLELSSGSDIDDLSAGYRREPLLSPHNQYLLILAEQGLTGLLGFVGLLLTLLWGSIWASGLSLSGLRTILFPISVGFLIWTLIDFCYADLGGPTSVVMSVMLGLTAKWAGSGLDVQRRVHMAHLEDDS